eukprot:scaffold403_cov127-Isochrysis_galbana.AAC.3
MLCMLALRLEAVDRRWSRSALQCIIQQTRDLAVACAMTQRIGRERRNGKPGGWWLVVHLFGGARVPLPLPLATRRMGRQRGGDAPVCARRLIVARAPSEWPGWVGLSCVAHIIFLVAAAFLVVLLRATSPGPRLYRSRGLLALSLVVAHAQCSVLAVALVACFVARRATVSHA